MNLSDNVKTAITYLNEGKIIAYPTEAVYGLGCDPFSEKSVLALLALKKRNVSKGLILLASNWQQIQELIQPLSAEQLSSVTKSWPGAITWVFPATERVPFWICGEHSTVAIRLTNHPLAKQLCDAYQKPIVSTSANLSGHPPAKNALQVINYFGQNVAYVLEGEIGDLKNPTPIYDVLTGKLLRS